ncbi:beta-1,4-glucuronyltransferase 1 [Phthorimaea operculella]|nr:beta-1,4-glucuronyltransferase 1 [Phthorimaea operculella]
MLANRRNLLLFRASIVINVCVLLYGALQLTSGPVQVPGEWAPITAAEATNELRFIPREDARNDSDATIRNYDDSTSQKTPSTAPTTNHTASSTAGVTELKPDERIARLATDDDENILTLQTLIQLKSLLGCNDRDFISQTMQRGEFWVLKNYIQAEHGNLMCHENITYTTHASYEFLDNVLPLVER